MRYYGPMVRIDGDSAEKDIMLEESANADHETDGYNIIVRRGLKINYAA